MATTFVRPADLDIRPLYDGERAFAFRTEPPGALLLDAHSLLLLELCNDRSREEALSLYAELMGDDEHAVEDAFDDGVERLVAQRLLLATAHSARP